MLKSNNWIHFSALPHIYRRKVNGKPVPFSFVFDKISTGERIHVVSATLVNEFFSGRLIRVKFNGSEQIREIRTITIIEINGSEVIC